MLAHDARTLLMRSRHGEWRVVLTDDEGRLQHVLLARRRPRPLRPRDRADRRGRDPQECTGIVELQVPVTLLATLRPGDHGEWAGLLAELRRRLRELGGRLGRPPSEDAGDLARRRPRVEIDRWTRVRDRHCVVPVCRRPAHQADLDHTHDRALGGPTAQWNLGVLDRHHHRAKHHGGWSIRQPSPGRFVIRTRAGVTRTTHPKRIIEPLPMPRPAARLRPLPDDGWSEPRDDIDPDWFEKIAPDAAARRASRPVPATPQPATPQPATPQPATPQPAIPTAVASPDVADPPPF